MSPRSRPLADEGMKADFIGYPLHTHTLEQTLTEIDRIIRERRLVQHCVLNAFKLYLLNRDEAVSTIVKSCELVQADGMSIVWIADLLGLPPVPRVTGIDLMDALIGHSAQQGHRLFFLGAKPEIVKKVVDHYLEKYPTLNVAGYHHGYFKDESEVVRIIRESQADILFVGFGSPDKEKFIHRNRQTMQVPFCMGVGGSFDVMAGLVTRAPRWVQRCGVEWVYRLAQEPRRLWKRYALCHLDLLRHIGKAFLTSVEPWQRLGFILASMAHLTLSFAFTALMGWAGFAVSLASAFFSIYSFRHPLGGFNALLFLLPSFVGVAAFSADIRPIGFFLAPCAVVIWSFLRHRAVVHELRFLSFPGKKWVYGFYGLGLFYTAVAFGRYVVAAAPRAWEGLVLSVLTLTNSVVLFLLAISLLRNATERSTRLRWFLSWLFMGVLFAFLFSHSPLFSKNIFD